MHTGKRHMSGEVLAYEWEGVNERVGYKHNQMHSIYGRNCQNKKIY